MTRGDTAAKVVSEHITERYGLPINLHYHSYLRTRCTVTFVPQLNDVISVGPSNTKILYVSIYLGVNNWDPRSASHQRPWIVGIHLYSPTDGIRTGSQGSTIVYPRLYGQILTTLQAAYCKSMSQWLEFPLRICPCAARDDSNMS